MSLESLEFSKKLMIFFRILFDLKHKNNHEQALAEFNEKYEDIHSDLSMVTDEGCLEINNLYEGQNVIFRRDGENDFTLILKLFPPCAQKYYKLLEDHKNLRKDWQESELDEVLRHSFYQLLPNGNGVEIKIKKGQ